MSFKYRFIFSFVLLEAVFILLIVSMNFLTISDSSKKLIEDKIQSNTIFLEQLVRIPISIYDLATLDDLVQNSSKYLDSVVLLDSKNKVLSNFYRYKYLKIDELIKSEKNKSVKVNNETYEIVYKKLYSDDIFIGSMYLIFDTSANSQFIENNKNRTILIILLEILISTILSYVIGSRLTNKLSRLSIIAQKIGTNSFIDIPYINSKDEIGILSNSMSVMQENLIKRNKDLKDSNKQLREQKYKLINASKAKDDFLANMSHELKTPLNSINVISDVMMRNKTNNLKEKQVKNLNIINRCGKDLLTLINDILDLSKLEANQIVLNEEKLDIKSLSKSIYEMFYPQTKEKGIDFILKIDEKLDFIYSDKNRIKQIVKNLLSNALKFTAKGKIGLYVEDLGDSVKFMVKDEGIGIPSEKLEHIFDRFKQADGSTTRKYGGTGLGLAICKELAHLLKGDIFVNSELNKGSSFELIISKNKELIKGLNTLDLKKNEDVNISEEKIKEEKIIVYNSDPVEFLPLILNLKKLYSIKQVFSLNDLTNNLEKIIIDFDTLGEKDLELIIKNDIKNIVAIANSKIVNSKIEERIVFQITKPYNEFDFTNLKIGK